MIDTDVLSTNQIGHSGEFLAASMLQRIFPAIAFPQTTSQYDILCEAEDGAFVKCQVKTTNTIEHCGDYQYWRFCTGKRFKKKKIGFYEEKEVDFFALVCLKKSLVFFVDARDIKTQFYRVAVDKMSKRKQDISLKQLNKKWNS